MGFMEFILAYGAGLLTLINPCVLPILPIVLASALQASRWGPIALAAGLGLSFVTLGVSVTAFGHLVGITEQTISKAGAILMIGFGFVLLVPQFSERFAYATAGLAEGADRQIGTLSGNSGWQGQFIGGLLLGAVWTPCVGPTLGGAISLASQRQDLLSVSFTMLAFALGIGTVMMGLAYGARTALQRRQAALRLIAEKAKPILGVSFILVGVAILTRFVYVIEAWLLDVLPIWLQDLSVIL